jgi:hypothetical protein
VRQLILLLALLAVPRTAAAQTLEAFEWRTVLYAQEGRGFQSQDGDDPAAAVPGNQHAVIIEPLLWARLRTSDTLVHEAAIEIDVVSAASPDAIDAMTSASKINESVTTDVSHRWNVTPADELTGRWGFHIEEPLRSLSLGGGYTRKLADDNFTLGASGLVAFDWFDAYGPYGDRPGLRNKWGFNGNLSASQVLSPTAILDVGYGITYQTGVLETTWNAVPTEDGLIAREELPPSRLRQAATIKVSQHILRTRSTLKASYRYYRDDFDLDAHTVQLHGYQYLRPWLYTRLGWRIHEQSGVGFYQDTFPPSPDGNRTSDSDLAPFTSHELTLKFVLLADRAPFRTLGRANLDASFGRYFRSNELSITWGALSLGYKF